MSIYDPLRQYLLALPAAVGDKTLSFGELEHILGFELPDTARDRRQWWENPSSPTSGHSQARAWLGAGWKVDTVSFTGKWARFTRTASPRAVKHEEDRVELAAGAPPEEVGTDDASLASGTVSQADLQKLGFEEVGEWVLRDDALQLRLARYGQESGILYAFVAESAVKYIGKSSRTLEQRLYGYSRPGPTQHTNLRIRPAIEELLRQGQRVQILALVQKEEILYRDMPLSLAGGLEDALIARFSPPWNVRG